MSTAGRKRFHWRAFVSLYITVSFVVIAVSGLVLFIAPPGRVANWSRWTLVALDKERWQAVHTVFAFLFVAAAAFHVYFNWRILMAYLASRLHAGLQRKWELLGAGAMSAALFVMTLAGLPPFSTVMTFGEEMKNSWATPESEPPVPHAELWTLAQLAETTKVPLAEVEANLRREGIEPGAPETTLAVLARRLGVTPQEVYRKATAGAKVAAVPVSERGGFGRKTIAVVCGEMQLPVEVGLERLRGQGIEATAEANVREVADRYGKTPIDLVKLLETELLPNDPGVISGPAGK